MFSESISLRMVYNQGLFLSGLVAYHLIAKSASRPGFWTLCEGGSSLGGRWQEKQKDISTTWVPPK